MYIYVYTCVCVCRYYYTIVVLFAVFREHGQNLWTVFTFGTFAHLSRSSGIAFHWHTPGGLLFTTKEGLYLI